jgi:hypothetical protein
MEWIRENWFWLVVFVLFVVMHMGHGGHGGHGGGAGRRGGHKGHEDGTRDNGPGIEPAEDPQDNAHEYGHGDSGGRHAER